MKTLGLRHVAIQVADPQKSKEWYMRVLKMDLEWEPDAENVYLTSGGHDNLAIHKSPAQTSSQTNSPIDSPTHSSKDTGIDASDSGQLLDHLGFALPSMEDVDAWYNWVQSQNVKILREIKTHRDGARSFYMQDLDGVVIQMIYHPPIAARASAK